MSELRSRLQHLGALRSQLYVPSSLLPLFRIMLLEWYASILDVLKGLQDEAHPEESLRNTINERRRSAASLIEDTKISSTSWLSQLPFQFGLLLLLLRAHALFIGVVRTRPLSLSGLRYTPSTSATLPATEPSCGSRSFYLRISDNDTAITLCTHRFTFKVPQRWLHRNYMSKIQLKGYQCFESASTTLLQYKSHGSKLLTLAQLLQFANLLATCNYCCHTKTLSARSATFFANIEKRSKNPCLWLQRRFAPQNAESIRQRIRQCKTSRRAQIAMASIAASPGRTLAPSAAFCTRSPAGFAPVAVYPEGLKKRARLADAFELSRKKRFRVGETAGQDDGQDEADVAKYSQRHVEYFEQVKQAEIARIRAEYEQFILKKDADFQRLGQELQHTQQRVAQQASDVARLQGENKLLKRAIAIQSQQKDEVQSENQALKQLATQAAEHMKRLEQANYTLRVHLQTSTSAGLGHHQQPPDVY
ncbi:unnamed protein product [Phytophthora lilii]|uniref:Unnamed protein product n=1 Tax=Phytophthora lilii TaxID=2077276 RepID=A0A9W6WY31_9STRA|nr:unnamed protein product [Phytophthora lilii]